MTSTQDNSPPSTWDCSSPSTPSRMIIPNFLHWSLPHLPHPTLSLRLSQNNSRSNPWQGRTTLPINTPEANRESIHRQIPCKNSGLNSSHLRLKSTPHQPTSDFVPCHIKIPPPTPHCLFWLPSQPIGCTAWIAFPSPSEGNMPYP